MIFKTSLFFVTLLSIYQVWYKSMLVSIFSKPVLIVTDYTIFSDEMKRLSLWVGLLLLVFCFIRSKKTDDKPTADLSNYYWISNFVFIIILCPGLVLAVNPQGRFPWNRRSSYTTISAHSIKPTLYTKLGNTPEVLILGSSISFTNPASYFKKKWGLTAFNMSVDGGGTIDFVKLLNYVIRESTDKKIPSTMIVEMLTPGLWASNPDETSLEMIPYLSIDQATKAFDATADDLFHSSSFFDSIFTLLFIDTHRWSYWINFADDGSGILSDKSIRPLNVYQDAVKKAFSLEKSHISCQGLNSLGKEYTERLISLSHAYQFSIVFYRSPINADFYKAAKTNPRVYERCRNLFNTYMETLVQQNPNISYRDLSNGTEISTMGPNVYLDTHHLNEQGNTLVMQALDQEIKSALAWAKTNRK